MEAYKLTTSERRVLMRTLTCETEKELGWRNCIMRSFIIPSLHQFLLD
jgi:hypothetical protein